MIDAAGRPVVLGPQLAAGGEGAVFPVGGRPDLVAKIYHRPPPPRTADKLARMAALARPELTGVAAWPGETLRDARSGRVAGFVMPRLTGFEPIHHLYNPAQRLRYFPRSGWRFAVRAAANCAAAFDEVHKTGCLVGDVNQSNVLVSHQAIVRLIDCDSFQVPAPGTVYLCEVGVEHYTPPELQRPMAFAAPRAENHDRFGLAVVIFQLLFVGRHPYAGVYHGLGDLAFDEAIRGYKFAYGPGATADLLSPPPHVPTLNDVPPELARLFCRAFERGSERAPRPSPAEWRAALGGLERRLAACLDDPGHLSWSGAGACVWCRLAAGGPDYFFGVADGAATFTPDDARLKDALRRLNDASPAEFPCYAGYFAPPHPPDPAPLPDDVDEHQTLTTAVGAGAAFGGLLLILGVVSRVLLLSGVFVVITFGVWFAAMRAYSPWGREVRRRRARRARAGADLADLERAWGRVVREYSDRHATVAGAVRAAAGRCGNLRRQYADEVARLTHDVRRLALRQHLRSCFISDATIPKIGDGRKQTLAAFGILTAHDVEADAVRRVRGFGDGLTAQLLAWRADVEGRFRFDPATGVPDADLRAAAEKYRRLQKAAFADADRGLAALAALTPEAEARLAALTPSLRRAAAAMAQAEADWLLVRPPAAR